ncbi:nodulation protein NodH [Roseobacter sp.]|uniref:nodulation protein NodH n=1 Tax=Roseobacter sp. TaxID=1907202 RepID=UPI0025E34D69|nr:nodulation protein NodH [Roseobacter sp.]
MGRFDTFVIFAEMRTGSNFLETNLNALDGVTCLGEAFNPHFIGYPDTSTLLGMEQDTRDKDPMQLLRLIRAEPGLTGFRYFHDHDPRVLDAVLTDERCAKVLLTRNPAESYVSWKIAQSTGQWKLTDVARRKKAQVVFDAAEFATFVADLQNFQTSVLHQLQASGQTAFILDYEDLRLLDVINGLAMFLGSDARLDAPDMRLKVQNPEPLSEKVSNFEDMEKALAGADPFSLSRVPDFEPRRAAAVPTYVAGHTAPLLYLPVKGGPVAPVTAWLAALDGVNEEALGLRMSQKDLRLWKRSKPGHRSFTVIRHPLARAHHAFCSYILGTGPQVYDAIRTTLVRRYGLPLPDGAPDSGYDIDQHRAAFHAFLEFLKGNLAGQTAIRTDAAWCSQAQVLQGFGGLMLPDFVIREDEAAADLHALAKRMGYAEAQPLVPSPDDVPFSLAEVCTARTERLAAAAYARDYLTFGFGSYS